jgi:hypothetical protein
MLSWAQKWASASIGTPLLGNMEGRFLITAFLFRGIFMRFSREMQVPCQQVSTSTGALLGVHWLEFLREKKMCIWVPFLDPKDIKILSLRVIWNFSKGTGLS